MNLEQEFIEIESSPRAFYVDRVRRQAVQEGITFEPAEQEYLDLTRAGLDEAALAVLEPLKGRPFEDFDKKLTGLAWRAYQHDIALDPANQEAYDRAWHALANSDPWPNLSMFMCVIVNGPEEERKPMWPYVVAVIVLFAAIKAIVDWVVR